MKKQLDNPTMVLKIQHLLHENGCTLYDADEIVYLLMGQLRYQRERLEYETYTDYFNGKRKDACNEIVENINYEASSEESE